MSDKLKNFAEGYNRVERWVSRRVGPFLLGFFICFITLGLLGVTDEDSPTSSGSILNNSLVTGVKTATSSLYPGITYGEAFDYYFGKPKWDSFEGTLEDGSAVDVVEFTGTCMYQGVEVSALIQFMINEDGESFDAHFLSFNDVPQSELVLVALLEDVFEAALSEQTLPSTDEVDDTTTIDSSEEIESTSDSTPQHTPQGEYHKIEYSSKYPGATGFYVTEEIASDYFVKNMDSLEEFECMEEFIDFKYAPIIFDFYVTRYTRANEYGSNLAAMDIELYMKDDYGWSENDYVHIAEDMRNAMYFSGDFSCCGDFYFRFYDGTTIVCFYDEMGTYYDGWY